MFIFRYSKNTTKISMNICYQNGHCERNEKTVFHFTPQKRGCVMKPYEKKL